LAHRQTIRDAHNRQATFTARRNIHSGDLNSQGQFVPMPLSVVCLGLRRSEFGAEAHDFIASFPGSHIKWQFHLTPSPRPAAFSSDSDTISEYMVGPTGWDTVVSIFISVFLSSP
jgi:hypothetical protein